MTLQSQVLLVLRLSQLDSSSPQFSDELSTVLWEEGIQNHASNLSAQDVIWFVEYLDQVHNLIIRRLSPDF